jgi:hypothetical protein
MELERVLSAASSASKGELWKKMSDLNTRVFAVATDSEVIGALTDRDTVAPAGGHRRGLVSSEGRAADNCPPRSHADTFEGRSGMQWQRLSPMRVLVIGGTNSLASQDIETEASESTILRTCRWAGVIRVPGIGPGRVTTINGQPCGVHSSLRRGSILARISSLIKRAHEQSRSEKE